MRTRPREPYVPCHHPTPEGKCLLPLEWAEHEHDANPPLAPCRYVIVGAVVIGMILVLFTVIVGWEKLSTTLNGG